MDTFSLFINIQVHHSYGICIPTDGNRMGFEETGLSRNRGDSLQKQKTGMETKHTVHNLPVKPYTYRVRTVNWYKKRISLTHSKIKFSFDFSFIS